MGTKIGKIIRFLGHLGAIGVIFLAFFPAGAFFLFSRQLIGVDSDHFLYFVIEYSRRLSLPPAGWRMTWFEGTPQMLDNPWFNFYLIQPLVKILGAMPATKIYLVFFLFLFLLFSYLVFFELSGSILLATALAVAASRSWAVYIQLYSAGVGLSSIAQVAFPAGFYFLIRFLKERRKKWLALGVFAVSFGFYSHALLTIFFILAPLTIFWFFSFSAKNPLISKQKIKKILLFGFGVLLLSSLPFFPFLIDFFKGGSTRLTVFAPLGTTAMVGLKELFESTNIVFFLALPITFVTALFFDFRKKIGFVVPLFIALLYFLFFQLSYQLGLNPLIGMLFPHRSFWLLPILIGAMISIFLFSPEQKGLIKKVGVWLIAVLILTIAVAGDFQLPGMGTLAPGIPRVLSGDFPDYQINNLFVKLDPETALGAIPNNLFDTQDLNHRLYVYLPSTRIHWNMFYSLPQTHGYYHYRTFRAGNWIAWLYAVFSRENFEEGGIPADIAQQQSLFLADWYAIRYIATTPSLDQDVAPHFYEDNLYILAKTDFEAPAAIELSSEFVSEIARPSKAPVLGFVGDDQSYDYFVRNLGMLNLNSDYLIPVRLANFVEDLTPERLQGVDGLIFYNYRKKKESKSYQLAWDKLKDFVQDGGVVLVETGADCPEKWGEEVPDIFPISKLDSGSLGTIWKIESTLFEPSDFEKISPLTYEGGYWAVSFAPSENFVDADAKILLKQRGKPVMAEGRLGKGKIIWSGLNLFYRPLHHQETALAEVQLLRKTLGELVPLSKQRIAFDFSRPRTERVILAFTGGHGALLKENNYGGWIAQATVDGKKVRLPILSAGPDFMYVPLPREFWDKPVKLEFVYQGLWYNWLFFFIAIATFLFLLDMIIFNQRIFNLFYLPLKNRIFKLRRQARERWDEEEA